MQDIENDMDDLFRRAAEKYPLHAGQGNWESIEKKISTPLVPSEPQPERQNNHKNLFPFLLLTIILLLIGYVLFSPNFNKYQAAQFSKQANQEFSENNLTERLQPKNTLILKNKKNITTPIGARKIKLKSANLPTGNSENTFSKKQPVTGTYHNLSKNNNDNYQKEDNCETINGNDVEKDKKGLLPVNRNTDKKESPLEKENVFTIENKKVKPGKMRMKETGLYAGLVAAIDFSKVKSTSFKDPGFNSGIIIGYKIKSFFAETGIASGHKYYSSPGKMFNEQNVSMPAGMTINTLESRSKILEIPLKAGYYFYRKERTNLFISSGTAIYIMTREKNNYDVMMNGNHEKMVALYEKDNLKIPAVFSISAGWEYQDPGLFSIKIEPVLKLPLQGIGVGKLPVTSVGIQLGITKMLQ